MHMNIWAVGRNYASHAKELGNEVPSAPMIFLKSGACISNNSNIQLPQWNCEIHHEIELALLLGPNLAPTHWTLALDLTDRMAQSEAKKTGTPWTAAKSFRGACPIAPWQEIDSIESLQNFQFTLLVNGQTRQSGHTQNMIFDIPTLLAHVERLFPVQAGDIILTGTPEGVGPLQSGDHLKAYAMGQLLKEWTVKSA